VRQFCFVLLFAGLAGLVPPVTAWSQDNESPRAADLQQEVQPPAADVAAAAARIADSKAAFVTALRRFVESLAATDGDEGPRLRAAAGDMRAALTRWDDAIKRYRNALAAVTGPGAHAALGSAYLDRGLMSQAGDQFRRAVTLAPRWGDALLLLSLTADAQGKVEESARALEKAAQAAPGSPAIGYARVQQAVARHDESAITRALLEFGGRHDGHVPSVRSTPFVRLGLLRENAGVAPVFVPAIYSDAFLRLAARRYDEAVAAIEHAVARDPLANAGSDLDERSWLRLAEAHVVAGTADDAERVLKEAVAALPDAGQPLYRLARLYQSQSRIPEALAAFRAATGRAMLVGRDSLFETIAVLEVGEGAFADAIADYRREIDANPNNPAAHRRLADLYAQDGRLGESLAELAAALLVDPGDADAHASRAQTLLRLSRFGDAEAAARRAVSLSPQHQPARYALGTALLRLGRTDEGLSALQEFERLQTATRARSDAAWQITLLKEQALDFASRQDYATAADRLRQAAAYAPADGSIRLAAGAFLIKAGKYADAVPLLKEALERGATDAQRYLAEAYAAMGKTSER